MLTFGDNTDVYYIFHSECVIIYNCGILGPWIQRCNEAISEYGRFCSVTVFLEVTQSIEGIAISQGLQITLSGGLAIYKICVLPKEGFYDAQIFCSAQARLK